MGWCGDQGGRDAGGGGRAGDHGGQGGWVAGNHGRVASVFIINSVITATYSVIVPCTASLWPINHPPNEHLSRALTTNQGAVTLGERGEVWGMLSW